MPVCQNLLNGCYLNDASLNYPKINFCLIIIFTLVNHFHGERAASSIIQNKKWFAKPIGKTFSWRFVSLNPFQKRTKSSFNPNGENHKGFVWTNYRKQYKFEICLCKFNKRKLTVFSSRICLIKLATLNYLLYLLSILISYIKCK